MSIEKLMKLPELNQNLGYPLNEENYEYGFEWVDWEYFDQALLLTPNRKCIVVTSLVFNLPFDFI